jgi:hypothetical protein
MSRISLARKMIKYLEDRLNCENILQFIGDHGLASDLTIEGEKVAFQQDTYPENDPELASVYARYDFMTEANYTGFEIFPYLYGVLVCHDGTNEIDNVFREAFDGRLTQLLQKLEHPSEWYDIAFQLIFIHWYMTVANDLTYDGRLKNHLYRRLEKPFYKTYEFSETKITVNHKYLIVLWEDNKDYEEKSNLDDLRSYLKENTTLKIPPSNRIIKLFEEFSANPENIGQVLLPYYPSQHK